MSDRSLTTLTALEMRALLGAGDVSPLELLDAHLDRIKRLDPALHAFLAIPAERARSEARAAEARVRMPGAGPLCGVPFAVKDLEWTEGVTTTMGSLVYRDLVPGEDALAVARLRAAGAILLGKTHTPEFGSLAETKSRVGEDTRNPWDHARIAGGSSGGSAAALAAGMTPLAIGSDTSGSISSPAGLCGVVGVKPTHGLVARRPAANDSGLFTDVGPMARTVADAALMLSVMAGHDAGDPWSRRAPVPAGLSALPEAAPVRALFSPDLGHFPVASDVARPVASAVEALAGDGWEVEQATPSLPHPFESYLPLYYADLWTAHGHLLDTQRDELHPFTVGEIEEGRKVRAQDVVRALAGLRRFDALLDAALDGHDVLMVPTNPIGAYPIGAAPKEIGGVPTPELGWNLMGFTTICNMSGRPAVSVPCGVDGAGMPVGLLLIGHVGRDDELLAAAAAYERLRGPDAPGSGVAPEPGA